MPTELRGSSVSPPELAVPDPDARAELERVLASRVFQRSERLRRFLRYVCEVTLRGDGNTLNEYMVGVEVFDRGADYSPQEDSIVRRQAHALRQKLADYYRTEGEADPVRIELPVGRYVPYFQSTAEPEPVAADPSSAAPDVPATARIPWQTAAAAGLVLLLIGAATGWLLKPSPAVEARSMGRLAEPVVELWRPWLTAETPPTICFSNPMTAVVKHFDVLLPRDSQPPRLLASPAEQRLFREAFGLDTGGEVYLSPSQSQTKLGEAVAGVLLGNLFGSAGIRAKTTQSRFLSWDDFRQENLILLGNDEANAWLDPILQRYPIQTEPTQGAIPRRIVVRDPKPGQPSSFAIQYAQSSAEATQEYALVSMVPGVDRQHRLLVVSGLNTQATQSAVEYITEPGYVRELLGVLRQDSPDHKGPWYFQAVLRCEVHDKVPTRATLVLARVVRPAPAVVE